MDYQVKGVNPRVRCLASVLLTTRGYLQANLVGTS